MRDQVIAVSTLLWKTSFSGAVAEAFPIATTAEPDDEGVVCDEEANDVMD